MTTVSVGQVWRDKDKRRDTTIEILETKINDDNEHVAVGLVVGTEEERTYKVERLTSRWNLVATKENVPEKVMKELGFYSSNSVKSTDQPSVQKTYLLKLVCQHDEVMKLRITQKMLDEFGYPLCGCHKQEMVKAETK